MLLHTYQYDKNSAEQQENRIINIFIYSDGYIAGTTILRKCLAAPSQATHMSVYDTEISLLGMHSRKMITSNYQKNYVRMLIVTS